MEEILDSLNMEKLDLIKCLEKISSHFPNRILKIEGFVSIENQKETLEIIIFKGFSSSTTHPIEIDLEKNVIEFDHCFTNFRLNEAPLTKNADYSFNRTLSLF